MRYAVLNPTPFLWILPPYKIHSRWLTKWPNLKSWWWLFKWGDWRNSRSDQWVLGRYFRL